MVCTDVREFRFRTEFIVLFSGFSFTKIKRIISSRKKTLCPTLRFLFKCFTQSDDKITFRCNVRAVTWPQLIWSYAQKPMVFNKFSHWFAMFWRILKVSKEVISKRCRFQFDLLTKWCKTNSAQTECSIVTENSFFLRLFVARMDERRVHCDLY